MWRSFCFVALMGFVVGAGRAQEAPDTAAGPVVRGVPVEPVPAAVGKPAAPVVREALPPEAAFDKANFARPLAADQTALLKTFAGATAADAYGDRQFRKLVHAAMPSVMFHYGRDMPLDEAVDDALQHSRMPVALREGRYLVLAGRNETYPGLSGRAMLWVDTQDGLVLGAFYFHPTNGEPTPSVTVFSKQVSEDFLSMGQLPPTFADEVTRWSESAGLPAVTTRYFIGGTKRKLLLEHDEDYCVGTAGAMGSDCDQMNEDASDVDENAAYFLDQTHYATNATAWMLGPDQVEWLQVRSRTCGGVLDPLGCHIRVTRERTRVILRRPVGLHPIHHP